MNVYITYDRYERNEWFSVYNIETNKQRAIKHCKEVDLPDFISYGPDDCHSFQLQKVIMTKEEYKKLCELVKENDSAECSNTSEKELKELLINIYDECNWQEGDDVIICTDGCSDNVDIIDFYIENYDTGIDESQFDDEDDYRDAVMNKLFNDEELYDKVLKNYIKFTY